METDVAERLQALAARQGVRRLCLAYDAADGWQASIDYGTHGATGGRCETPGHAVYSLEAWLEGVDDG